MAVGLQTVGMVRPLRIEYPGAVHHVTSRGDRREPIYRDDQDRCTHLDVIARALMRFDARALAWCLMGNHYHLVLRTGEIPLSRVMRQINGVYTQAFNRRHGLVGHVLQGRYHATLVDSDGYLAALCRYVERNPVAAGLIGDARAWTWSSARAHLGLVPAPDWLDSDGVLGQLSGRDIHDPQARELARQAYARLLSDAEDARALGLLWQQGKARPVCLGDDAFSARIREQAGVAIPPPPPIPTVDLSTLRAAPDRRAAIARAHHHGGHTLTAIAAALGLSVSRVSRILKETERGRPSGVRSCPLPPPHGGQQARPDPLQQERVDNLVLR
ncbi:MAG: hypothetical protein RIQ53_2110 [Pseudomonadota bacterium]